MLKEKLILLVRRRAKRKIRISSNSINSSVGGRIYSVFIGFDNSEEFMSEILNNCTY